MKRALTAIAGTLLAAMASATQAVAPETEAGSQRSAARVRIEYRVSPLVDLYFTVRARAEKHTEGVMPAAAPEDEPISASIYQAPGLSGRAVGRVEGLLSGCSDVAELRKRFEGLPEVMETKPDPDREEIRLRELALNFANALAFEEPAFREKIWPAHERAIAAARERIETHFKPKEAACYARLARDFGFEGIELVIPVYLVAEAPFPGAVTHRGPDGLGVCFVSVSDAASSQLLEKILHETIHALDVAAPKSVLASLRELLRGAGFGPRDHELRDVPHTLMFVEAAAVIRREVDPAHQDYGDVARYYAKIPSAVLVREAWTKHLEGKTTRNEALLEIVAGVIAARGKK